MRPSFQLAHRCCSPRALGSRPPQGSLGSWAAAARACRSAPVHPCQTEKAGPRPSVLQVLDPHSRTSLWRKVVALSVGSLEPPFIFTPSFFQKASKAAYGHRHRPKKPNKHGLESKSR